MSRHKSNRRCKCNHPSIVCLCSHICHSPFLQRLDQDVPQTAPQNPATPSQQPAGGLCSRTYITFSDDEAFEVALFSDQMKQVAVLLIYHQFTRHSLCSLLASR